MCKALKPLLEYQVAPKLFAKLKWLQSKGGDDEVLSLLHVGHVEDVRRQVNEAIEARQHKIDRMYAAFTGQPLETVQQFTERDRFLSASEALEFVLIDGLLETEY
ncbi:hypothetical protein F2Q68_00042517 [Brassica cretica]|uniref:Uncharacterized protein n=1 Tax=Brassica cretica TaxID=69181 RepID=A0A8S9MLE7_BRACR|nr:hypothetical protein F2Q68_00042517 [Brassica cretica]